MKENQKIMASKASGSRKLKKNTLPKFEADVYSNIPSSELVVFSVHYLIERKVDVTLEDIISICFLLFPNKFGLKKYPKWPDSALVIRRWGDARKKKYVVANTNLEYKLTSKGLSLVKKVEKSLGIAAPKPVAKVSPAQPKNPVITPAKKAQSTVSKEKITKPAKGGRKAKAPAVIQKKIAQLFQEVKVTSPAPVKKIRPIRVKKVSAVPVKQAQTTPEIRVLPATQVKKAQPVQKDKATPSAPVKKIRPIRAKKASLAPIKQIQAPEIKVLPAIQVKKAQPVQKEKATPPAPVKKIRPTRAKKVSSVPVKQAQAPEIKVLPSTHVKKAQPVQKEKANPPAPVKKVRPIRAKKVSSAPVKQAQAPEIKTLPTKQVKKTQPAQKEKATPPAPVKKIRPTRAKKISSAPVKQAQAPEIKILPATQVKKTQPVQEEKTTPPAPAKKIRPIHAKKVSPAPVPVKQVQAPEIKTRPEAQIKKKQSLPVSKPIEKTQPIAPSKNIKPAEPVIARPVKVEKAQAEKTNYIAPDNVSKEIKERAAKFTRMMERSDAYIHYKKNGSNSKINEFDFRSLLLCTMESSPETLARNVDLFKGYAEIHNRQDLVAFLIFCKDRFSHLLIPQNKSLRKAKK
jgi:hypothetical protein